jgi:hypothetical protein
MRRASPCTHPRSVRRSLSRHDRRPSRSTWWGLAGTTRTTGATRPAGIARRGARIDAQRDDQVVSIRNGVRVDRGHCRHHGGWIAAALDRLVVHLILDERGQRQLVLRLGLEHRVCLADVVGKQQLRSLNGAAVLVRCPDVAALLLRCSGARANAEDNRGLASSSGIDAEVVNAR